jgi:hypothetical protein
VESKYVRFEAADLNRYFFDFRLSGTTSVADVASGTLTAKMSTSAILRDFGLLRAFLVRRSSQNASGGIRYVLAFLICAPTIHDDARHCVPYQGSIKQQEYNFPTAWDNFPFVTTIDVFIPM